MKWQQSDRENWFKQQTIKRSYQNEVVSKIQNLKASFDVHQYGALSQNPSRYPLFLIKSQNFSASKKTILVSGGVHGYETSGVHGSLEFLRQAQSFESIFNIVCTPCLGPWAYETINRWNAKAIDPNRSFRKESPAEECQHFLKAMESFSFFAHFDLHETTDTDNTVFRPALEARDGIHEELTPIPDGFYVVGDSENPQPDFQRSIIESVRKVTHIAAADESGNIIGVNLEQDGVINYPLKKLSLCTGFSDAQYTTTTEVYPDSPRVTGQICIEAQVAAITGGLHHLKRR